MRGKFPLHTLYHHREPTELDGVDRIFVTLRMLKLPIAASLKF